MEAPIKAKGTFISHLSQHIYPICLLVKPLWLQCTYCASKSRECGFALQTYYFCPTKHIEHAVSDAHTTREAARPRVGPWTLPFAKPNFTTERSRRPRCRTPLARGSGSWRMARATNAAPVASGCTATRRRGTVAVPRSGPSVAAATCSPTSSSPSSAARRADSAAVWRTSPAASGSLSAARRAVPSGTTVESAALRRAGRFLPAVSASYSSLSLRCLASPHPPAPPPLRPPPRPLAIPRLPAPPLERSRCAMLRSTCLWPTLRCARWHDQPWSEPAALAPTRLPRTRRSKPLAPRRAPPSPRSRRCPGRTRPQPRRDQNGAGQRVPSDAGRLHSTLRVTRPRCWPTRHMGAVLELSGQKWGSEGCHTAMACVTVNADLNPRRRPSKTTVKVTPDRAHKGSHTGRAELSRAGTVFCRWHAGMHAVP